MRDSVYIKSAPGSRIPRERDRNRETNRPVLVAINEYERADKERGLSDAEVKEEISVRKGEAEMQEGPPERED